LRGIGGGVGKPGVELVGEGAGFESGFVEGGFEGVVAWGWLVDGYLLLKRRYRIGICEL
jgi:hypothetical protein